MPRSYKVAYLVSHPIQYQAPLLRYITAHSDIDLTAFFLSDFSVRSYKDAGFGTAVQWDVPLLEGYQSVVLPALGSNDRVTAWRPWTTGLRRHLKTGGFDALWLHGYSHPVNLRAMMVAQSLGIKVFVRAESQLGSATGRPLTRRVKEPLLRWLFSHVDAFLAIGSLNREYYCKYGVPDEKIFSMPYTVDNDFFQSQVVAVRPKREVLRQELDLTPGRPIILFASKFLRRKRAGDLLEAYIRLSPDGIQEPKPYLLFIGDGEERSAVEGRAQQLGWSSVRFLGFKNQTELPRYFDLCDVFVLPSDSEPWGLIVNEVMNAAKPIIVTDQVGCWPDLVQDGVNGFVYPVGNINVLANRLREITCDFVMAQAMGEQSASRISQWGFRENVEGLEQALSATVGRKSRTLEPIQ